MKRPSIARLVSGAYGVVTAKLFGATVTDVFVAKRYDQFGIVIVVGDISQFVPALKYHGSRIVSCTVPTPALPPNVRMVYSQ